jgi:thiamine pyrophosphate-dependent acetolactate synthase large subunit-like protein
MLGSMGLACPIATGVAIAQPKRRVIGIEGDGSLLMQLGALGTIASLGLKNLVIVVMDNGAYQITGGQATLTAQCVDLVAMARGAGIAQSAWATNEADFEQRVERALANDGPWLIAARTDNKAPEFETERDPSLIRDRFMRGLGVKH